VNDTFRCVSVAPWLFSIVLLLACACTVFDPIAGGGTDIANARVSGFVVTEDGMPAKNTSVAIIPVSYNPLRDPPLPKALTVTTDLNGKYEFPHVDSGSYLVEMVHPDVRTRALSTIFNVASGDSTTVPLTTLRKPSLVKITIPDDAYIETGAFYVPGTTLSAVIKNNGGPFAILDSVPVGTLPSLNYYAGEGAVDRVIRYDVKVLPGDTTFVSMPSWKYSRKLRLNTTSAGADVAGNAINFPVLVRLNNGNFAFSQALKNGDDVRFTKENGSSLACEIEQWDAATGRAAMWVKVDTVYGNDSAHFINMYWGNSDAVSESNGVAVFDPAAGFAGVWHLNQNDDSVFDATGQASSGMNSGTTPTTGIIGTGRKFASGDYIKIAGLLKTPANVTLSAWVNSDTVNSGRDNNWGQEIISIGDYALVRLDDTFGIGACGSYQNKPIGPGPDSSFVFAGSGRYLANTGWHFIAFSINTVTYVQALYIDGAQYAIANDANPICYSGLGSDTYIGIHGNGEKIYNFSGRMDEVRANNVALTADWIKLCFMNQKGQDALVKW
jgi:hypothetical protein